MSDPKKPLSLRARIARLDALIPVDPDRLCCLEAPAAWRDILRPHFDGLSEHLTLDPVDADPPLDPPELPLAGICKKGGELCPLARERAALIWTRRRRLALAFKGLDLADL